MSHAAMQVSREAYKDVVVQEELMTAAAELPELQDLAISGAMCGPHIARLAEAKQLTRLEFVAACEKRSL